MRGGDKEHPVKSVWNDGCLPDLAARWDARATIIETAASDGDFDASREAMRRSGGLRMCAQELRALARKLLADQSEGACAKP